MSRRAAIMPGVNGRLARVRWPMKRYSKKSRRHIKPAVVLDLFSCRIPGWAISARMTSDLVLDALQQARTDIFFYIEAFYNRQRRHSTLGYVSPAAHEAAYYQHQLALT